MRHDKVDIITMGCSKNLVDSERLARMFERKGYSVAADPEQIDAQTVVVNTCGFIGDAKEESVEMILRAVALRGEGRIGRLIVMGCLSQRYLGELREEIPEVDAWYGKFDWPQIVEALPDLTAGENDPAPARSWERSLSTPPWSAFLKISEGCDRFCAFCAIPLITGRHTSRPLEEIAEEARTLVARGVKEFNVIAQDLSSYGRDLYGRPRLADLVDTLARTEGVEWIRLHYAYPSDFPYDLLPVMARHSNVCRYLDIALQHIADPVLGNMRRHITAAETRELLARIRREVPGIAIRTTLMVGFPGEGEREFAELLDFVREQRFDRMGAFAYCEEEDTWGARHLEDTIPEEEKQRRLDLLMQTQAGIAAELNAARVGERMRVLVESYEEGYGIGRTEYDSPEVDQEVLIRDLPPSLEGEFVEVEITAAGDYELYARPL